MIPKHVDLNLIRIFLAVYQNGSVSGAVKQLNLTQPAISNAINRLNALVGRPLFYRQGRGIQPTHEAANLYQNLVGPYAEINSALLEFHQFEAPRSTRSFSVSLSNYFDHLLPRFARLLEREASQVRFERVQYNLERNLQQIENATLDLMLTATEQLPEQIRFSELAEDRLVLVARRGHPLVYPGIRLNKSRIRELRFASLIAAHEEALPAYFVQYELGAEVLFRCVSFTSLLDVVEASDHVALVPEIVARNNAGYDIEIFDLPVKSPMIKLRIIWPGQYTNDPGHLWLRKQITQAFLQSPSPRE